MSMTWIGVCIEVCVGVLSMGFLLRSSEGNSRIRYSCPKAPGSNLASSLPDLINRLTVLVDTPSDLAACAIVIPCLDICIDKCIDKSDLCQGVDSKYIVNCLAGIILIVIEYIFRVCSKQQRGVGKKYLK